MQKSLPGPSLSGWTLQRVISTVRPTEDDIGYPVPTLWMDTTGDKAYILVDVTSGVATWTEVGGSSAYDAQESVLSIATAASVPPTETTGDRYILNGTPHANWDGAVDKDIVEFDGAKWVATTPNEGMIVEVEDVNTIYIYFTTWTAWLNQALLTTSSPTFANLTLNTNPVTLPGSVKMFTYYASVGATTGTFNLPAITTSSHGILTAGANLYSATFRTDNVGNVQLLDSDSGGIIVANADTAAKLAIGDAAATDIIPITNRTAGALVIMVILFYN